jgi:branched-chain amino acid transport system substrate-binding protein
VEKPIHPTELSGDPVNPSRRQFIKKTATAAVLAAAGPTLLTKYAHGAARPIKIGLVSPKTGPMAVFAEPDDFVLTKVRKLVEKGVVVNGTNHPVQILVKDCMSDPNRAAEVASSLIKADKVDLIMTADGPDIVNPVADQAELNGVPCITGGAPLFVYFFGRGGKRDRGFDWTYHFFWGEDDLFNVYTNIWGGIPTNKTVGVLWSNDADGNADADKERGFPPVMAAKGFKLVDPGRFEPMTNDFSSQISTFKRANAEIVTGVLVPPAFTTFWSQCAQQNYRPKVVTIAKALLFPASVATLGNRAEGLTTEIWWSPGHPFKSPLTGQTAADICHQWESETGKQWTPAIGFRLALFELALDTLKRTKNIDSPASIRDAIRATNLNTIVGPIKWSGEPLKNCCRTPLVGGQWVKGKKFKYDLVVVNNETYKAIPTQMALRSIPYAGA